MTIFALLINSSRRTICPTTRSILSGSRTARFTARSLAGLITACGILFRQWLGTLPDAWKYYRSPKPHSPKAFAEAYKAKRHLEPSITFLGVWDTWEALAYRAAFWRPATRRSSRSTIQPRHRS
ncbi:DUF2235 domain-containing protein [Bradyrhizobium sp. AUGA SZCCT0051]|nr:DUF2235 domain-containing protein [Bradyrhizobium sp. AUGA SZCCT0124]MBR1311592.1 DUF2235 domain-containing protein [Bradyrhizobium sp. AUGA SZCCT0051]MBR1338788.1 DUF2235 domain-containing protein [Bradyrhizobium sp. AUGA SZCCT0105]MBR1353362.1 DUF2235 domain-containing protein [Bradyrhizobium sp. AUGA SZCCT0045]